MTGGGWITDTPSGTRANFAVAGADGGWGHLTYIDHGAGGPRVKGTAVLTYTSTGPTSRHIHGTADIDGRAGSYDVDVADNGEPGHGADTFALLLSTGYASGGTLKGGNIQLAIYTTTGASAFADEKSIRRAAVTYRVPCITTMSGARAAAEGVAARLRDPIRVWSLQEIHASKTTVA